MVGECANKYNEIIAHMDTMDTAILACVGISHFPIIILIVLNK